MICELCGREKSLTYHHCFPKELHGRKKYVNRYGKKELKNRQIGLCLDCHRAIHSFYTNKELADNFNTKELLMADEKIAKFVQWISKR